MDFIRRLRPPHLRLVLKIADVGQLQIAAQALAMSQPAASRIIADIEKQAGEPLFFRTPKGMEPTPMGDLFIRHTQVILSELDILEKEARDLSAGLAGEVRIGSVTGPAVGILIPALHAIRAQAPNLSVTIEVGPSTELVRGLEEGRFDFIFARIPATQDSREFLVQPARSEVVRLMVRKDHPLATADAIRLEDLSDYDWVIQERGSPIRQAVEAAHHSRGVPIPARVINSSSLLIVQALLAGSDVIAPQSHEVADLLTSDTFGARLQSLTLDEPIYVSPYFVISNRGREMPRGARRFYDHILQAL